MGKDKGASSEADQQKSADFQIKPSSTTPPLDTSKWPLLLKNYDQLCVRTGHYTPIPSGHTLLKRSAEQFQVRRHQPRQAANPLSHEVVA